MIQEVPEIHSIANVTGEQISQVDSGDMTYNTWLTLAACINEMLASNQVKPHFYRLPARKHTASSEFDVTLLTDLPQVEIIYGYLNSSPILAEAAVKAGAKGIVYAGLGNGNMSR